MPDIGFPSNCRRVIAGYATVADRRHTLVVRLVHLNCLWGADNHSVAHFDCYDCHFDDSPLLPYRPRPNIAPHPSDVGHYADCAPRSDNTRPVEISRSVADRYVVVRFYGQFKRLYSHWLIVCAREWQIGQEPACYNQPPSVPS